MKSIFGSNLIISLFGESHNDVMGVTIHGIKAGIRINKDYIDSELFRRRPKSAVTTSRVENDEYEFISGYFNDFTTGSPLTILLKNSNVISSDYQEGIMRPSHADYAIYKKTHGYNDYRGGGHTSGRLTALIVIAGAICKQILLKHSIEITSEIEQVGKVRESYDKMLDLVYQTKSNNDSIGGIIKVAALGLEAGVGEPFFDSIESILSHLFFSIPAVKAVEFGIGKDFASCFGSEVIDNMLLENNKVKFLNNNNGGVNGGISNGMDIIAHVTFKPTPTIAKPLQTVDLKLNQNIEYIDSGRHDSAIVLRSGVICEAMMAIGLLDLLITHKGTEWM